LASRIKENKPWRGYSQYFEQNILVIKFMLEV
jgi:hypothetical protein